MKATHQIQNLDDLLRYFDARTLEEAKRTLYKHTGCGAWMTVEDNRVTLGSIVEGLDGDGVKADALTFPFSVTDLEHTIAWVEDRTTELYNESYDAEEETL